MVSSFSFQLMSYLRVMFAEHACLFLSVLPQSVYIVTDFSSYDSILLQIKCFYV